MVDKHDTGPSAANLRTLVYHLSLAIDENIQALRKGTIYENARSSDGRVFVTAARNPRSISDIARELQITRQAAQMSVQRLVKLGLVELKNAPGNSRDKQVIVTPRGQLARKTAARQIQHIEDKFAQVIGRDELERLRGNMVRIVDWLRENPNLGLIDPEFRQF
ncbi:MAG: winged helix-turn-helix transcriptional regulator [Alphaproteobacteria bacterium]|nr:winged helix-turn-helix transcriptional regulator [Alphaproteobacteria bacterium]